MTLNVRWHPAAGYIQGNICIAPVKALSTRLDWPLAYLLLR